MSVSKKIVLIGSAVFAASTLYGAIMSPESRVQRLEEIREVVSRQVRPLDAELLAVAPSPFSPDLGKKVEVVEVKEEVVLSDEELLNELSEYINPTGIFKFNGEFYLIFKEKKLKVGSELGVTFKNTEYSVIITEITGSTYAVEFGDAALQLKLK